MNLLAVVIMATFVTADAPRPITKDVGARPARSSTSASLHLRGSSPAWQGGRH